MDEKREGKKHEHIHACLVEARRGLSINMRRVLRNAKYDPERMMLVQRGRKPVVGLRYDPVTGGSSVVSLPQ